MCFLVYAGSVFNIVVLTESWSQSVSHLTDIVYMARVLVYAGSVFNIVVLTESSSQSVSHLTDIVYMARVFSVCWICLQHCCID